MPEPAAQHAVFLSYAREDTDAARRIADALRGFGVEVWFDQNELRGGDAWDQKIRGQIRSCALFMPMVSANTQQRAEGYFRREWKIAVERMHDIADGVPFIVPVVIDGTAESAALVPEQFMRVQWTRLEGGIPTPEFVTQTKRLLEPQRRTGAVKAAGGPAPAAAPAKPSQAPLLAVGAIAAVAIAAALYFALRPAGKEPAITAAATPAAPAPVVPAAAPAPAPKATAISNKSIAVLPFVNMSEEKESAFFADGVHEDVLTNLALVKELKVVSRTTVTQYRDSKKTLRQIGEELGVAYVLEGSVRRLGNKVRVTGQLINAQTDEHVWAKNYDRDLTDIFAIQTSLAQEIATALQAAISPQTQKLLERRPTENPVAYEAFLKGRDLRNRSPSGAPVPLKQSEANFQLAVDQDPNFAAAWGSLAVVHALHIFWEIDTSKERLAKAEAAIQRATQLAPEAPDVISQIGTYSYYAHRDYARANQAFEKLAQLKPNDPTVYASLGLIQRRQGNWVESLANLRRATALDPGNAGYTRNLIQSLQMFRRWPELIAEQKRYIAMVDDKVGEQFNLALIPFYASGSTTEAKAWLAALPPEQLETPRIIARRKQLARIIGDYAEYVRLDRLQPFFAEDGNRRSSQAIRAAYVYFALGDEAGVRQRLADHSAEMRELIKKEPTNMQYRTELAEMEALLGHEAEAERLARENLELMPISRDAIDGVNKSFWTYIAVQAIVGHKDAAFAGLERFLRLPSNFASVHGLRVDPALVKLRTDPRWEALLKDPAHSAPLY